jgi:glycogen debranching enzyme
MHRKSPTFPYCLVFTSSAFFSCSFDRNRNGGSRFQHPQNHNQHPKRINGCEDYVCELRQHIPLEESTLLKSTSTDASKVVMEFQNFLPGSVVAIRVNLSPDASKAVGILRHLITGLSFPLPGAFGGTTLPPSAEVTPTWEELQQCLMTMTLADMNMALYRCEKEEVEDGRPGSYIIPNFGSMTYCGLQGVISLLGDIRPKNDLGHPLCNNLREGDWLPGTAHANESSFEQIILYTFLCFTSL